METDPVFARRMTAVSTESISGALPKPSLLRERMRSVKDTVIANSMGKDDSWPRKFRNGEFGIPLEEIPRLLDALGLRVVPVEACVVDRELVGALITINEKLAPQVRGALLLDEE